MNIRLAAACLLGCAILSACDKNPVSPDSGLAEAFIQDVAGAASVTGRLSGNMQVSVWSDGWTSLGSPNGITVPLNSGAVTVHGAQSLREGFYSRVRLTMQGVTAFLQTGSVVGGTTLISDVTLELGGDDFFVDITVSVPAFEVTADEGVKRTIIIELRSQQWLTAAAVQSRRVEDAALRSAITVSTRSDPQ